MLASSVFFVIICKSEYKSGETLKEPTIASERFRPKRERQRTGKRIL